MNTCGKPQATLKTLIFCSREAHVIDGNGELKRADKWVLRLLKISN